MSSNKKPQFQIITGRSSTTHKAYYTGTLNLSNLSAVLIDGEEARIDLGLIHAKSRVERGIKFFADETEVPEGKTYWVVWVAITQGESGPYYAGVAACPMRIDAKERRGWKNLALHVNRMDDVLKCRMKLEELPHSERITLAKFLQEHSEEMWNNSSEELKRVLAQN